MNTRTEMTPPGNDALLNVADVARMLGVTPRAVRDMTRQRICPLPSLKLPGSTKHKFRRQTVLTWIASQENGGKPDA